MNSCCGASAELPPQAAHSLRPRWRLSKADLPDGLKSLFAVLVLPSDAQQINRAALRKILDEPTEVRLMGNEGMEKILVNFSAELQAEGAGIRF